MERSALQSSTHDTTLLCWCVAGSMAAHALLLTLLPGWRAVKETPPIPLTVELKTPPPEIVPPKALPVETPPPVKERVKPTPVKPDPVKVAPRDERPVEQPRAPILTAPPEAPVTVATPVVPEQKPASPPEPPRPPPAPVAAPAPPVTVTPPSYGAAYLRNPLPEYPLAAKRRRESGTVTLRVVVTPEGKPANITLDKSSGSTSLDAAARKAVESWTFVPAREGNQPVQGVVIVPWRFTLPDE
jgi:periplasmic protein TonB